MAAGGPHRGVSLRARAKTPMTAVPPRSHTQARGRARRQRLLDAALKLLEKFDLQEITIPQVADHAGIPPSSAYNFFSDISDLYVDLAAQLSVKMTEDSISNADPAVWQDVVRELFQSGMRQLNASRPGRRLLIGPWSAPALRKSCNDTDKHVANYLLSKLEQHFHLPDIPRRRDVFMCAMRIGDAIFALSVEQCDQITDYMREEATSAVIAYLSQYLPNRMMKRLPTPVDKSGAQAAH